MADDPPNTLLERLSEGNIRFIKGETQPRNHVAKRAELVSHQRPYACIITCSDSITSPEILFDAGLGELFVVRNAGNVVDRSVLASMEYATQHLGIGLIVVLGHEGCGAVNAACSSAEHVGNLARLLDIMRESVELGGDDPARVVVENVRLSMERLRLGSEILLGEVVGGRLTVRGAVYSLDSGVVRWIE